MLLAGGDVVSDRATPEFALLEGFDVEAGDDAEVVGATFQRAEEIGIRGFVGVDYFAVGEDEFVVKDIVAEKAVTGGEERDASYDRIQESANVAFLVYREDGPCWSQIRRPFR